MIGTKKKGKALVEIKKRLLMMDLKAERDIAAESAHMGRTGSPQSPSALLFPVTEQLSVYAQINAFAQASTCCQKTSASPCEQNNVGFSWESIWVPSIVPNCVALFFNEKNKVKLQILNEGF